MPCGIFNSLSGFYSLDASSLPSWISDTQKLLQKLPNVLPLGVEGKIGSPTPCWRSTGLDWSICIVFVGVILGWWEHECHPPFCLLILFNFYTLMRMALILEKRSKDQKKKKSESKLCKGECIVLGSYGPWSCRELFPTFTDMPCFRVLWFYEGSKKRLYFPSLEIQMLKSTFRLSKRLNNRSWTTALDSLITLITGWGHIAFLCVTCRYGSELCLPQGLVYNALWLCGRFDGEIGIGK